MPVELSKGHPIFEKAESAKVSIQKAGGKVGRRRCRWTTSTEIVRTTSWATCEYFAPTATS